MKILVVTEKCHPLAHQRDGGARLVTTLSQAFKSDLKVMQFGKTTSQATDYSFEYPHHHPNRFIRRLKNGLFIAECVKKIQKDFTHIFFVHLSMQFGLPSCSLEDHLIIWTFPMFLTPSYIASGEIVPDLYFKQECRALQFSSFIVTPSYLEKKQLQETYNVGSEKVFLIPRGVDTSLLPPKKRKIQGSVRFCSIGSIKSQKNTLELLSLFKKIADYLPSASLKIIGPIQDASYGQVVLHKLQQLGLKNKIILTGPVDPQNLGSMVEDCHIHLSTSSYETFGRSIFETLALGIPNLVVGGHHAAADFLSHLPYIFFSQNQSDALSSLFHLLSFYPIRSQMAIEVGELYNDDFLAGLLVAKIGQKKTLILSDFDGTLYHKDDPSKTEMSLNHFHKFPVRVICSARPPKELLLLLKSLKIDADYIIAGSGAIAINRLGEPIWKIPLPQHALSQFKEASLHKYGGKPLYLSAAPERLPDTLGFRREVYQNIAYLTHWNASKLKGALRLLRWIEWKGQVSVYGDSKYDQELIRYFDGTWIQKPLRKEVQNASYIL